MIVTPLLSKYRYKNGVFIKLHKYKPKKSELNEKVYISQEYCLSMKTNMSDMAPSLGIKDFDMRIITVFTLAFFIGSTESAGVTATFVIFGFIWASISANNTRTAVNDMVYDVEEKIRPITNKQSWQRIAQPLMYILFVFGITGLALI